MTQPAEILHAETLRADVPVIETGRLILRAPRLSDLDAVVAFGRSDRARYVGGPMPDWQGWGALAGMVGHWVMRGFGWWMIEDKASGAVAGRTGVGYQPDMPEPELGWHVYDGFEGRGIAFEAALAARRHASRVMGLGPLISLVDPENTRSRRLAERMGATVEGTWQIRGSTCLIFRHPAEAAQ